MLDLGRNRHMPGSLLIMISIASSWISEYRISVDSGWTDTGSVMCIWFSDRTAGKRLYKPRGAGGGGACL